MMQSHNGIIVRMDWFQINPSGVEVSDPIMAAALCCRSQFWGNAPQYRAIGPQYEFKPGMLGAVDVQFKPQERKLCVIFVITGDAADLRVRRVRFGCGELYIPDTSEWRGKLAETRAIVEHNREKASNKLNEYIAGGAL